MIVNRLARWTLPLLAAALAAALLATSRGESAPAAQATTASVLFVGNNWDGTADIVDPKTFEKLGHFNVVPDLEERMNEIYTDPERLGYFLAIRQLIGEGNDQFVDDMFSSHDGRYVFVSRPSLADVVGIDLNTKQIVWRFQMEGQRADHMGVSPDGTRLLVSDSTANKVHELDTATGKKVGEFPSGDSPHESNYSADGKRIFHASIGLVYTPTDQPVADSSKGDRWFQIVESGTNKILQRWDVGQLMRENGFGDGYSSAVRPMAIAPDEKIAYLQLSFLHGFIVFDLANGKPLKVVDLPKKTTEPRENYLLDSAHHGLSINPAGTKLCAAGTMDGYAALVSTKDFSYKLFDGVDKPYWSTNSGDGRYCFVSASGTDKVVVLDYETEQRVAEIPVGDHPQRMRMGVIRSEYLGRSIRPAPSRPAKKLAGLQVRRARVRDGRLSMRLKVRRGVTGSLDGPLRRAHVQGPHPAQPLVDGARPDLRPARGPAPHLPRQRARRARPPARRAPRLGAEADPYDDRRRGPAHRPRHGQPARPRCRPRGRDLPGRGQPPPDADLQRADPPRPLGGRPPPAADPRRRAGRPAHGHLHRQREAPRDRRTDRRGAAPLTPGARSSAQDGCRWTGEWRSSALDACTPYGCSAPLSCSARSPCTSSPFATPPRCSSRASAGTGS